MNYLQMLSPAFLECAAVWLVLHTVLPPARPALPRRLALAACCALHLLAYLLTRTLEPVTLPDGPGGQLLLFALPAAPWLLYACIFCQGRLWKKLLTAAAVFLALQLTGFQIDHLSISAFGFQTRLYVGHNRRMCLLITDLVSRCFFLALCMLFALWHQKRQPLRPLHRSVLPVLVLLPPAAWGLAMADLSAKTSMRANRSLLTAALCLALLALEAGLVWTALCVRRALQLQSQCRQQLQQQQREQSQTRQLRELFHSQRAQTHEYRNRLTVLSMLLAQQQYSHASSFLQQLTQCTYQDSPTVQTNHPIADAVLNLKYVQARQQQTAMRFMVGDLSSLPFTDDELVKLLGNLLDNALEACRRLDSGREIDLRLLCQDGGLVLSVRNPLPPEEDAPSQPSPLHGFGLQTVDRVLQRYAIPYAITREYGWFQFSAMGWPEEPQAGDAQTDDAAAADAPVPVQTETALPGDQPETAADAACAAQPASRPEAALPKAVHAAAAAPSAEALSKTPAVLAGQPPGSAAPSAEE